jgi:hypothetical protein
MALGRIGEFGLCHLLFDERRAQHLYGGTALGASRHNFVGSHGERGSRQMAIKLCWLLSPVAGWPAIARKPDYR